MPGSLQNIEDAMKRRRRDMMFLKDLKNEGRITPAQKAEDQMLMQRNQRDMDNMTRTRDADKKEKARLMAMANKPKNIMGQKHSLAYMTDQEMEAMNQLKSEPGLRGRLARKGAKKKMNMVDGIPAFYLSGTSADYDNTGSTHSADTYGTYASSGLDNPIHNRSSGGGGGGDGGRAAAEAARAARIQREFDKYKAGEAERNRVAAEERLGEYRGERRQQLTDEFGGYKDRFKALEDQYDVSAERDAMQGLAGEAKQLGQQFGQDMAGVRGDISGYESDVAGLRGDVSALRGQQAGIGARLGGLADQALDPMSTSAYDRNRRMLAGVAEQQRNAANQAAQEQLNRGAAASGMSPEQLSLARARLAQGQGAQARQDALSSAMGAQQMTQGQLAQGAGLLGQQASLGMQQAQLAGQQAGLGMNAAGLAQNRGGLLGQAAGFQSGILGQRGGFQGQSANLLNQQLMGKAGLMGQQVGMTEYQLQDVVAQQNQEFEREMAEKGYAMQRDAANANRPRTPSTMDQLTGLATAVAPIAIAAFSDKKLKKNIRSAKDKDLLEPEQIDGFLDSLFAKQYNYKSKKHGEGKQVGIMAQDLEKTQLGKQMVENTPEGKRVNFGKGLGLVMASQARLNERLNSIGA